MSLSPTSSRPSASSSLTSYRKVTAKTVSASVAETDLLNGEITVAAAALGATGVLIGEMWGDWLQNATQTLAPALKFKFGGTVVAAWTPFASLTSVANSATRFGWHYRVVLANANATNAQTASVSGFHSCVGSNATGGAATTITTGLGGQGQGLQQNVLAMDWIQATGSAAIDTTSSVAVTFTATNPSTATPYDITLRGAIFYVV